MAEAVFRWEGLAFVDFVPNQTRVRLKPNTILPGLAQRLQSNQNLSRENQGTAANIPGESRRVRLGQQNGRKIRVEDYESGIGVGRESGIGESNPSHSLGKAGHGRYTNPARRRWPRVRITLPAVPFKWRRVRPFRSAPPFANQVARSPARAVCTSVPYL